MTATLHIIASCTERKSQPVPAELQLRDVAEQETTVRARAWWSRLKSGRHDRFEARNLYAGEHWSVVLELPEVARENGFRPQLWVASAGYGLIPADAAIHPYSATFARGEEDSVVKDASNRDSAKQVQLWWKVLSEHVGPSAGGARSIKALVSTEPHASFLIVASPLYVTALAKDLAEAVGQLARPERLLIVSSPSPLSKGGLASHWIPSSAHHQQRVKGSKISLHARVAREIITQARRSHLDAYAAKEKYEALIETSAPPLIPRRSKMSDEQVRAYIEQAVKDGVKSWSASHRLLRSQGRACEQSRFKRLFLEVQEGS